MRIVPIFVDWNFLLLVFMIQFGF